MDVIENIEENRKFAGVSRVYGRKGFERLQTAKVCVIGLGGVGSWTVESLARSGVGSLTLVDADSACISNTNRQIQALESGFGRQKTALLSERIQQINPECSVEVVDRFITPSNIDEILGEGFDYVVDAIDSVFSKTKLIARCKRRKQKIIVCGGAAGQLDPTKIQISDLSKTKMDPLLRKVRKELRTHHGFSTNRKKSFGVPAIYSVEDARIASDCAYEAGSKNCETGLGSLCHTTAMFGFYAAALVTNRLALDPIWPAN